MQDLIQVKFMLSMNYSFNGVGSKSQQQTTY